MTYRHLHNIESYPCELLLAVHRVNFAVVLFSPFVLGSVGGKFIHILKTFIFAHGYITVLLGDTISVIINQAIDGIAKGN